MASLALGEGRPCFNLLFTILAFHFLRDRSNKTILLSSWRSQFPYYSEFPRILSLNSVMPLLQPHNVHLLYVRHFSPFLSVPRFLSLRLVVCPCPYICLLLCRCPTSFTSPTPSHPVPKWSALWRSRQFRMPDRCMHAARLEWSFRPIAFPRRFASDRRLAWRRGKPLRDNFIIGVFQRWSSNEYYSNILPIHQPLILEAIRLRNIALHCSVHARSHAVSGGST